MAIPKELETLIEGFTPEETSLFDNLLTKQATLAETRKGPKLAEGWLRQSDYDKNMNGWKEKVANAETVAKRNQDWFAENKPIHDAALQNAREWEEKTSALETSQKELQQKLADAEARRTASGDDTVDPAELERRVKDEVGKLGYATRSEVDTIINEQTRKLAREEATSATKTAIDEASKRLWNEDFPQMVNHAADVSEIAYDHKREFEGENFDRAKFAEFLVENKISDFKKGYEKFVEPRRTERDFNSRVDKEVKQRVSGMMVNGGMPVAGGPQEKGALQMRIEKDAAGPNSLSSATSAAAAELRSEGRF